MLFLDMDGVLVDFDKGLEDNDIINCKTFIHLPKDTWSDEQLALNKAIISVMRRPGFFSGLPPMTGYKELWDFCLPYGHKVLTARPDDSVSGSRVSQEKQDWLLWHIGEFKQEDFICCLRSEKPQYALTTTANPNLGLPWFTTDWHRDSRKWISEPNILVDDMESNCHEWEKAGGRAVLFKSAEQSIEELKRLVSR